MRYRFPVMPLCDKQLRDVNEEDILEGGLYRLCNVYKGGGGYDKFPTIAKKRLGVFTDKQFVVQLRGCPLKCHYCYVTPEGINGPAVEKTADELIGAYRNSGVNVFHLMGGAPALYLDKWEDIIDRLNGKDIFHSDLMLIEQDYSKIDLSRINKSNCLYAVSIKGNNSQEHFEKTGTKLNVPLFWSNFDEVVKNGLNFYITFTDIDPTYICELIYARYGEQVLNDAFTIDMVEYEALK